MTKEKTSGAEEVRMISWNVNGIRACLKKDFVASMKAANPDILCLQETKCQAETLPTIELDYPYRYFHYAEKKGYSGTAILSKIEPLNVRYDGSDHPGEGRLIEAEYEDYYLVNTYVPNSKDGLRRLKYRTEAWDPALREYLQTLSKQKPVILCGDLNVAHQEIDLANPAANRRNAGFTDEEREQLAHLLDAGFVDTFRVLYPDQAEAYSWWSYRTRARERNAGWRIDYFLMSENLQERLSDAFILKDVLGSDHCPVGIVLNAS